MSLSRLGWAMVIAGVMLFLIGTIAQPYEPPPVKGYNPPPVMVQKAKPVVITRRAGDHSHLCPRCRTEWWHGSGSFGRANDHHCPACGYGPVLQVYRR